MKLSGRSESRMGLLEAWPGSVQRRVRPENVSCPAANLPDPTLSQDEIVSAIQGADEEAIDLARGAEESLDRELTRARDGEPVDAEFDTILQEEFGLTLTNRSHFGRIRQQRNRYRRVRETLESGYLKYLCPGERTVSLIGCGPDAPCRGDQSAGASCPGNRMVILCGPFWFDESVRSETILHEPFHIWFTMARHAANQPRLADVFCFDAFAFRVAGIPEPQGRTCVDKPAG